MNINESFSKTIMLIQAFFKVNLNQFLRNHQQKFTLKARDQTTISGVLSICQDRIVFRVPEDKELYVYNDNRLILLSQITTFEVVKERLTLEVPIEFFYDENSHVVNMSTKKTTYYSINELEFELKEKRFTETEEYNFDWHLAYESIQSELASYCKHASQVISPDAYKKLDWEEAYSDIQLNLAFTSNAYRKNFQSPKFS